MKEFKEFESVKSALLLVFGVAGFIGSEILMWTAAHPPHLPVWLAGVVALYLSCGMITAACCPRSPAWRVVLLYGPACASNRLMRWVHRFQ